MLPALRVGSVLGFPIRISFSFLLMLGVVMLSVGGLPGLTVMLIAFGSILLHELGHAVVARRLGVSIREIEFHFFGGAAKMMGQPRSAGDEIKIAVAGPAVSFLLAAAASLLGAATGSRFLSYLGVINLIIGAFNLVPALPMDGGRILRAVLARRMGFLPATRTAISVARWFALALGVYGLLAGHLLLVPLAVVLWLMGFVELAAAHVRGYAGERPDPWQTAWMPRSGSGFDSAPNFDREPEVDAGDTQAPTDQVEYIPPGGRRPSDGGGPGGGNGSFRVVLRRL